MQERAPSISFPAAGRDRIAVASYPFREFIAGRHDAPEKASSRMALKDFAAHIAGKLKVRRIEPWSEHFLSTDPAYLDEMHNAVSKAGCEVANVAADGRHSGYARDPEERKQALQFAKTWIELAARLGSPSVRLNVSPAKDGKPDVQLLAEMLKPVAEHGALKNVAIHLENDNPLSEDPFFLVGVLEQVNSPWLHALPDFGNSLAALPAEEAYRGLDQMFAHAYAISHVKDTATSEAGKVVTVDVDRSFAIAKKHGYKGFFSMESETPGDVYEQTAKLIDATVRNLS